MEHVCKSDVRQKCPSEERNDVVDLGTYDRRDAIEFVRGAGFWPNRLTKHGCGQVSLNSC